MQRAFPSRQARSYFHRRITAILYRHLRPKRDKLHLTPPTRWLPQRSWA